MLLCPLRNLLTRRPALSVNSLARSSSQQPQLAAQLLHLSPALRAPFSPSPLARSMVSAPSSSVPPLEEGQTEYGNFVRGTCRPPRCPLPASSRGPSADRLAVGLNRPPRRPLAVTSFTPPKSTTPIQKWRSTKTGLSVVWAGIEGPIVNGSFVLGTEIFDDTGAGSLLLDVQAQAGSLNPSPPSSLARCRSPAHPRAPRLPRLAAVPVQGHSRQPGQQVVRRRHQRLDRHGPHRSVLLPALPRRTTCMSADQPPSRSRVCSLHHRLRGRRGLPQDPARLRRPHPRLSRCAAAASCEALADSALSG